MRCRVLHLCVEGAHVRRWVLLIWLIHIRLIYVRWHLLRRRASIGSLVLVHAGQGAAVRENRGLVSVGRLGSKHRSVVGCARHAADVDLSRAIAAVGGAHRERVVGLVRWGVRILLRVRRGAAWAALVVRRVKLQLRLVSRASLRVLTAHLKRGHHRSETLVVGWVSRWKSWNAKVLRGILRDLSSRR